MTIVIRDTTFNKTIDFKSWEFPGGEVGVKIDIPLILGNVQVEVTGYINSYSLMVAKQIISVLNQAACKHLTLFMPYLPYARQDRVCNVGEDFALKTFIESFFRELEINQLVVYDLHSHVSADLLHKYVESLVQIPQAHLVRSILKNYDILVFPDKGAARKQGTYNAFLHRDLTVVSLDKTRVEGKVFYPKLELALSGKKALVVDDICDGGATFVALAQSLVNKPAQLDLYVTHGIFSQGLDTIYAYYHNVFTANLMSSDARVVSEVQVINI